MDKVNGKLTVFFEEPFWVGIFERIEDGKLSAPCIHSEWVHSAGTRTARINTAMISVQENAMLIFAHGVQQKNRKIRFQRHGVCVLRTDIL